MVFLPWYIFLSEEEIILFDVITHHDAKIGTNDVTLQYKLHLYLTFERPKKPPNLINIYINVSLV